MSCCKHQLPQKLASSAVSDELLLRWLKGTYRGLKQLLLLHTKALAAETTRAARYLPTRVIGQACRARRLASLLLLHRKISFVSAESGTGTKHEPAYSQQGNRRL